MDHHVSWRSSTGENVKLFLQDEDILFDTIPSSKDYESLPDTPPLSPPADLDLLPVTDLETYPDIDFGYPESEL